MKGVLPETNRIRSYCGVIIVALAGCGPSSQPEKGRTNQEDARGVALNKSIEDVLRDNTPHWVSIGGVVGAGIGEFEGKPCLVVFVEKKTLEIERAIPSEVSGYSVTIEETGRFEANGK